MFTFPEAFDNAAWTKVDATITADSAPSPYGVASAADLLLEAATTNFHLVEQDVTLAAGTTYTASCYMKASGRTFGALRIGVTATLHNISTWYDLTNGVVGSSTRFSDPESPTIVSYGVLRIADFWRCLVVFTANANAVHYLQPGPASADGVGNYAGDITKGILMWGAKLEVGRSLAPYA